MNLTETKKQIVINNFLLQKENAQKEVFKNFIFITHDSPCALAYFDNKSRSTKPASYRAFKNEDQRSEEIQALKNIATRREAQEIEYNKRAQEENAKIKIGAILSCSWGYDQTNVDFYIILSRTAHTVSMQEIGAHHKATGSMTGEVTPDKTTLKGKPFKKRISKHGGIKMNSYSHASIWDGRPLYTSSYA